MKNIPGDVIKMAVNMEKEARQSLSKEMESFVSHLPDDNKIKEAVEHVKEESRKRGRDLDIASLPDTHPLIVAIRRAKDKWEQAQDALQKKEQAEKAKDEKPDANKEKQQKREAADKKRRAYEERRVTANNKLSELRKELDKQVDHLTDLYKAIDDTRAFVAGDYYLVNQIEVLKRLVAASRNGLKQARIREWRGE